LSETPANPLVCDDHSRSPDLRKLRSFLVDLGTEMRSGTQSRDA
jgi:hypothetical protein